VRIFKNKIIVTNIIYSSLLSIKKRFKKSKFDNFISGLFIGAVFSLLVNIATVQVQELITKQKVLEALEHEIMLHYIQSGIKSKSIVKLRDKDENSNPFSFGQKYDTSVWDSGITMGYLYDLDPSIQSIIEFYYPYTVYPNNKLLDNAESAINNIREKYVIECILEMNNNCDSTKLIYDKAPNFYEESQLSAADFVNEQSFEVLEKFHPTQDRLDNIFLRMFMGTKTHEVLRREDVKK
jgi:hypothetical protein